MSTPSPSGMYPVGSKTYTFVDSSRLEQLGPNALKEQRKLSVRMYYPADVSTISNFKKDYLISREVMNAMAKEFFIKMDYDKNVSQVKMKHLILRMLILLRMKNFL